MQNKIIAIYIVYLDSPRFQFDVLAFMLWQFRPLTCPKRKLKRAMNEE